MLYWITTLFFFLNLEMRKKTYTCVRVGSTSFIALVYMLHIILSNYNMNKIFNIMYNFKNLSISAYICAACLFFTFFTIYLKNKEKSNFYSFLLCCCVCGYMLKNNSNFMITFLLVELLSISFIFLIFYKKSYNYFKNEISLSLQNLLTINFLFSCFYLLIFIIIVKQFVCFSYNGQFFYLNADERLEARPYVNLIIFLIFLKSASPIILKYKFDIYEKMSVSSLCAYIIYSTIFSIFMIFQISQIYGFVIDTKIVILAAASVLVNYKSDSGVKEITVISTSIMIALATTLL